MAKNTGNTVKKVNASEHNCSCQRWNKSRKELATLEEIEKALLDNAHNPKLHTIIVNPHHMKIKDYLRTLLTEDLNITEHSQK